MVEGKASTARPEDVPLFVDSESNKQIRELEERCRIDLMEICENLAQEQKVKVDTIFNLRALKVMAEKMPETEAEMLQIPYVTKANFEKYGKKFLEITQTYAAQKHCN